jgi:hypothetical protein
MIFISILFETRKNFQNSEGKLVMQWLVYNLIIKRHWVQSQPLPLILKTKIIKTLKSPEGGNTVKPQNIMCIKYSSGQCPMQYQHSESIIVTY